jgi:hypothetical protein
MGVRTMDKKPAFQIRGFLFSFQNMYLYVFDKNKFLCAGLKETTHRDLINAFILGSPVNMVANSLCICVFAKLVY